MHEQYVLNLYANTNAIGSCFGGKNYKVMDPFDDNKENKSNNKQTSAQDIAFYSAFGIEAKDVAAIKNDQLYDDDDWDNLSAEEKRKLLFR